MAIKDTLKKIVPSSSKSFLLRIAGRFSTSLSQTGQDYWVYGEVFNQKKNGFFLDIGAHDGVHLSNTYLLEKKYKWKGICIEGNPKTSKELVKHRNCQCINACVDESAGIVKFNLAGVFGGIVDEASSETDTENREVIEVKSTRLDELLKNANAPAIIDYMSIDIEGAEDRALLTFPFDKYRFNAITIERPSVAVRELLHKNGYILIKDMPELDCYYVHEKFIGSYNVNAYEFGSKKLIYFKLI